MSLITLTSDFGADSPYVAQMKASIYRINPQATVVDVCHSVKPQAIAEGALVLANVTPHFPAGSIHVAVVDPGVGTERRILVAELDGQFFVAPDNGLLTSVIQQSQQRRIFCAENRELWRSDISATFHGRDIMAPVAAHLSTGFPVENCGPALEDPTLIRLRQVCRDERRLVGEIISIDSFGNCVTNIVAADLEGLLEGLELTTAEVLCGPGKVQGISQTYGDVEQGKLLALIGSSGQLEVAINQQHASRKLNVCIGEPVVVTKPM